MLDPYVKPLIKPVIKVMSEWLCRRKVSANTVTLSGFGIGIIAIFLVATQHYYLAAPIIFLNRFCDGLDGEISRHTKSSDFGGALDIICDCLFYAGLIVAFGFSNPEKLIYTHILLFSYMGQTISFLTYAILAAKKNKHTTQLGVKSFYYIRGVCEGTESMFIYLSMCLFTECLIPISMVYAALCWITTIGRIYALWKDFSEMT